MTNPTSFKYVTKPCPHCTERSVLELTEAEFEALEAGKFAQDALPNRTPEFAEQAITGFHPECWDQLFGPNPFEED